MHRLRRLQSRLIGFALVAALLGALMPSVSRAVAAASGVAASWSEVCTLQGQRLVWSGDSAPASSERLPPGAHVDADACGYCVLAAQLHVPPAPAHAVPRLDRAAAAPSAVIEQAPRSACVWRTGLPRAPPERA